jgi:hypothetical protein
MSFSSVDTDCFPLVAEAQSIKSAREKPSTRAIGKTRHLLHLTLVIEKLIRMIASKDQIEVTFPMNLLGSPSYVSETDLELCIL